MDGSNMQAVKERPIWNGTKKFSGWMRAHFAEWFIGSWALILGWFIVGVIFFNFMLMDGHFSRGLGEGSGVNPDRFQQVGWMYRCFAALFLVLAVKLWTMGLKKYAWAVRILGLFITALVVLHATGFGLKALEGKRAGAIAVAEVHEVVTESNAEIIATLEGRQETIRADLKAAVDPLKARMALLDKDGEFNEDRTDALQKRVEALENAAQDKIDKIDDEILAKVVSGGEAEAEGVEAVVTTEKWAPLFVGLAQFFTHTAEPTDWSIYLAGVIFIVFWVIVGDAIAIVLPSALYELHLKDAKNAKVKLSPDTFADLQAQADELARRKAKLGEGAEKAVKTKTKKKKVQAAREAIEDMRTELAKREADLKQKVQEAIDEMGAEYVEEDETPAPPQAEDEGSEAPADEPEDRHDLEMELNQLADAPEEPEQPEEEFHAPAVIEHDKPADEGDERKPLQAAE